MIKYLMISLHLENTIIELEIPCNKTLKNKKKSFIFWFQLLNISVSRNQKYFEMVEVWYWCSMVLLHSFEQFQYDYKQKKIFGKVGTTVAGNSHGGWKFPPPKKCHYN